jgi:signal transduction histidine kinase/CheY-like chemotaxis protein
MLAGFVSAEVPTAMDVELERLYAEGPVAVLVWRREVQWRVAVATPNVDAVLGYPADDFLSGAVDYADVIHEQDSPEVFERVGVAATGNATDLTLRYRIVAPNGEQRRVYDRTRILRDPAGEPEAFVSYLLDVSGEAGEEAGREMIAHLSHEIRTPLSGMLGLVEALGEAELEGRSGEIVGSLREVGQALMQVVNNVLDLSRIEAGAMALEASDFRLGEICVQAERLFARRAEAQGVTLRSEGEPLDPALRGDPGRLRQVVFNLVGNAVKFTREGEVVVRWRVDPPGEDGRALARVEVADTGVGMSADALSRVFESYRQAHERVAGEFGGVGLGLAISRQLAAMMGGRLWARSAPGEGSTFFFEAAFDLSTSSQSDVAALRREEANAEARALIQARSPRILAAEDAAANARMLELLLTPLGATVTVARDGREAVDLAAERRFDLILMDTRMPRLSGVEATAEIRRMEREREAAPTPVLALTAETLERTLRSLREAGVDEVMAKPFDPQRLYHAIAALLANAPPPEPPPPEAAPAPPAKRRRPRRKKP